MTTKIMNLTWQVKDLHIMATTKAVRDLVAEYEKDPNCRPYDFVASEKISDIEKAAFINAVLN